MVSSIASDVLLWTILTSYCIFGQKLSLTPSEEEFVLFSDRSFFVRCQGTDADSLAWVYNDVDEIMDNIGRVHVERSSSNSENKTLDLFFEKLLPQDKGIYSCIGSFSADDGQVRKMAESFKMTVYQTISFEETALIQTDVEGADAMLKCIVSGNPTPSVQWRFRGRRIQMDKKFRFMKQDGVNIMVISKVERSDKGDYTCRAKQVNDHFSDFKETDISFVVEYPPESHSNPEEVVKAPLEGKVNLTCEADGQPAPEFRWARYGQSLESRDNYLVIGATNASILQITNISEEHLGQYQCFAQNRLGTLEKSFNVKEGRIPAPPAVSVRLISANAVQVTVDEDIKEDNVRPIGYIVQYKTKHQSWPDAESTHFSRVSGEPYIIRELREDTKYEFRAASVTHSGPGDFGSSIHTSTGRFLESRLQSSSSHSSLSPVLAVLLWLQCRYLLPF